MRLFSPVPINFNEAIIIAALGLAVNIASIFILGSHHEHKHDHSHDNEDDHHHVHDHNHHSAVLHVMADALTSFTAIIALVVGKFWGASWLDPIMGIVGSIVILRWAYLLGKGAAKELLDVHVGQDIDSFRQKLSSNDIELLDYHSWKIGPANIAVQLIVKTKQPRAETFYRSLLAMNDHKLHIVVEHR